jgi:glutathione S-transferase
MDQLHGGVMANDQLTFYYNPMSRGRTVHWMLEEVQAPYETKILDWKIGAHKQPDYLKINPMGKIPAIVHKGVVVTEVPAILTYLADAFPEARLAPDVHSPDRGAYYRWLFFAASNIEPAMIDLRHPRVNAPKSSQLGHGSAEDVISTLERTLNNGFLVGDRFTTADLFMSANISWWMFMKFLEPRPAFKRYVELCQDRPGFRRHMEKSGVPTGK